MKPNNIITMLKKSVLNYPKKTMYKWKEQGQYQTMSYEEFWEETKSYALGLLEFGAKENDKIAILSNSNPMWAISDFAIASIGGVSVPIYPTLSTSQVAHVVKNADVSILIVENEDQYKKVESIDVGKIIVMYPNKRAEQLGRVAYFKSIQKLATQVNEAQVKAWEEYAEAIHENQLLTIIHTSGSSGAPKGAMLTHKNILSNVQVIQDWVIRMVPDDVTLSYLPISHVFERMAGHYTPISVGATIGYAESIETILENFQGVKPTIFTSVPRLFEKVHTEIKQNMKQSSSMKNKIFNWALSVGKDRYEVYVNKPEAPLLMENEYGKKLTRKGKKQISLYSKI